MCFTVRLKSELKATVASNSIISFKNLCLYFLYNVIQFCPGFKLFAIRKFQSGFRASKFTAYAFRKGVISDIAGKLLPAPSRRTIKGETRFVPSMQRVEQTKFCSKNIQRELSSLPQQFASSWQTLAWMRRLAHTLRAFLFTTWES